MPVTKKGEQLLATVLRNAGSLLQSAWAHFRSEAIVFEGG